MNIETIHYLNLVLGAGAIALQILSLVALFVLFFLWKKGQKNVFLDFIDKHFLILGFLISLLATLFSLVYSEIINFAPCYLCWWARILLYPQVLLFGLAFWTKDRKVIKYITPLVAFGFLLTVYHNFNYYFAETGSLPCDASGVSCYQQLVSEYNGYISIPMLALSSFFAILTIVIVTHFYKKFE